MNCLAKAKRRNNRRGQRRGATAVEAALVLPFFLLFCFVMLEATHAIFIHAVVRNAARDAARFGTTERANSTNVTTIVENYCSAVVPARFLEIKIADASGYDDGTIDLADPHDRDSLPAVELSDLEANHLFMVQIKVNYNDVAFMKLGNVIFFRNYFEQILLEGRAFMRRE